MNIDYKEKNFDDLIEKQNEEIEDLKLMLKETKIKLEEHEKDTELLTRLYKKGYIDLDGNPVERDDD